MKASKSIIGFIASVIVAVIMSIVLFFGILYIGNKFINIYGDITGKLKINDIIIYIISIIQLVVTGILSYLVYKLSKNTIQRELNIDQSNKVNALYYIKNEVNYNKNIVIVLENRDIAVERINKHIFKMDAWNKYSVVLLDLLNTNQYNKLLSYYSMLQLYGIKEIEKDILTMVKDNSEVMEMIDGIINKIN